MPHRRSVREQMPIRSAIALVETPALTPSRKSSISLILSSTGINAPRPVAIAERAFLTAAASWRHTATAMLLPARVPFPFSLSRAADDESLAPAPDSCVAVPADQPCSERWGRWHPQRPAASGQAAWGNGPARGRRRPDPRRSGQRPASRPPACRKRSTAPEAWWWPALAGPATAAGCASCRAFWW